MPESMQLPAILPAHLMRYEKYRTDQELLDALVQTPSDLIDFFQYACDDETWSSRDHIEFTQNALSWFEKKSLQRSIPAPMLNRIADIIQLHPRTLAPHIARGITLHLNDKDYPVSGLLMIASSDYLHELIDAYCEGGRKPELTFDITSQFFKPFDQYILYGDVEDLWREPPEMLHRIMDQARKWDLEELAIQCEDVLKRYIDRSNVMEKLLEAHAKKWPHLKNACIDFINQMHLGIILERGSPDQLICRLQDFKIHTLDAYEQIKSEVTCLQFRGRLTQETGFDEVVQETPKLKSLDLSETDQYVESYSQLPATLTELILNRCSWLNAQTLGALVKTCPNIQILQLVNNVHLDVSAYAVLPQLKKLKSLNIARCKVDNNTFKIVLTAARSLEELNINDCGDITPAGFTEMARITPELAYLSASNTEMDDGSLAEIGLYNKKLIFFDVSFCSSLSKKGILEIVRIRQTLKTLVLKGCDIPLNVINAIKADKPQLTILQ